MTAEPMNARARPADQLDALFSDGFPPFITADQEVKRYIGTVREAFAHLELVLLDAEDLIVAAGWGVPIRWSGEPTDLPAGYTASLARAVEVHARGTEPNTLVIMAVQVRPDRRGRGIAGEFLGAMRRLARDLRWESAIAPVRPTLKARYPLHSIDRFAAWVNDDGLPLDPWLRTHVKHGARVIATAPRSQTMTGSVSEWQTWTQMAFPESGNYVIGDGLAELHIDLDADLGTYVEPNIWVEYPSARPAGACGE